MGAPFEERTQTSFCYYKRFNIYIQQVDTTCKNKQKSLRVWFGEVAVKYAAETKLFEVAPGNL